MHNSQILSCSLLVSTTSKVKFSVVINVFMIRVVGYYTNGATILKVKFSVVVNFFMINVEVLYYACVPLH